MYEFFEHTADLGLRARAGTLETLFEDAARGLFAIVVESSSPAGGRRIELRIDGTRRDYLLFDWLNELLYRFDCERSVLSGFVVTFDEEGLSATAIAENLDLSRHRPIREVKAITYHQLTVEPTSDGWLAEVIVDI